MKQRLPLKRAIAWILVSSLLISGSATAAWYYFQFVVGERRLDPAFDISILVQTGPEREALKSDCLAELLGISGDKPTSIYDFDVEHATAQLLACPVIKEAVVRTYSPNTIYVDYAIRKPIAYLGDYTNTAIDAQGYCFPSEPYYTPKKLPQFYLGLPSSIVTEDLWGKPVQQESFTLATAVFETATRILGSDGTRIVKVDTSMAFADSYGQRQIVLVIEEVTSLCRGFETVLCYTPRILRLATIHYEETLRDYTALRPYLRQQIVVATDQPVFRAPTVVVDLRLPNLAYLF